MAEENIVKKFVGKKVMDWKFRKAGEGHSLSEEKGKDKRKGSAPYRSSTGKVLHWYGHWSGIGMTVLDCSVSVSIRLTN